MSNRSLDGEKANTHLNQIQFGLPENQHDEDDKYLDVVGTQSPLKTSIQRMHLPQQSGKWVHSEDE